MYVGLSPGQVARRSYMQLYVRADSKVLLIIFPHFIIMISIFLLQKTDTKLCFVISIGDNSSLTGNISCHYIAFQLQ